MNQATQDIIDVVKIVAYFNPPMAELAKNFEEFTANTIDAERAVKDAFGLGNDVFEALTKSSPRLADCVHDFVYLVACPFRSVIFKNLAREQVVKVILNIV